MSRLSSIWHRVVCAWRALGPEQRLAAGAALGLLVSMFLPWYDKSAIPRAGVPFFVHDRMSAFGAFSFSEATVFLAAAGVVVLMFLRGEDRRRLVLPGGDGPWVLGAGAWCVLVIFVRVLARPGAGPTPGATVGIAWGFFVAFVVAGVLTWAGVRLRGAEAARSAPAVVEEPANEELRVRRRARSKTRVIPADGPQIPGQMSFEEAEPVPRPNP